MKSSAKDTKRKNSSDTKERNAVNNSKDTIGSTRDYVSGDSAPSSSSHKFEDVEKDSSNDSSL